jgi:hypothetical protein
MNTQPLPRHPRLMPGLGLLLGALIATAASRRKSCRSHPRHPPPRRADDAGFHLPEARRTKAPARGRAKHPHHPDGRCGSGHPFDLRRRDPYADARSCGEGWDFLQPFHSTAMCSPTRAALLTGRNHTNVGNGQIAAIANDFDGFSGTIPKSSATVAEVLKNYGYNTGCLGQMAQHAGRTDHLQRPVRLLADRLRL